MILLTSMPIIAAASRSSDTARIGGAHLGLVHDQVERPHRGERDEDHEGLRVGNAETEDLELALQPNRIGVGANRRAVHAPERVLEEKRRSDRANERGEGAYVAEWPVADALHHQRDHAAGDHRQPHDQNHGDDWIRVEESGTVQTVGEKIGGEGPAHHHVAVGEIDEAQDAVHHRVAERDEGVDPADHQSEHEVVEPLLAGVAPLDKGADGAAHDDEHDEDAHPPQHHIHESDAPQRLDPSRHASARKCRCHRCLLPWRIHSSRREPSVFPRFRTQERRPSRALRPTAKGERAPALNESKGVGGSPPPTPRKRTESDPRQGNCWRVVCALNLQGRSSWDSYRYRRSRDRGP